MQFCEKWVLITGASRGIGSEIARSFAEAGADLILFESPALEDELETFCGELSTQYNSKIITSYADLCSVKEIEKSVEEIKKKVEKIDILINNAGVNIIAPSLSFSEEQWDMVMDVNLKGAFFLTKEIAQMMIPYRHGSVVMIASQHGIVGNENRAAYCASKAGLINMTRALSFEWAKYGIRMNSISPTFVITENNEKLLNESQFQRNNLNRIPLRKYAVPKDIAKSVLFLASDNSEMVTGHNLVVDGGWTAI